MPALINRFVRRESGFTAYGLIAAALMLIGVGAWAVASAPRVVASTQINPLKMMANAKDLPTPHYDYDYDTVSSSGHVASLVESSTMQQRRVNKSHRRD
jgi:hypothetical protein